MFLLIIKLFFLQAKLPDNAVLYMNRALCHLRLKNFSLVRELVHAVGGEFLQLKCFTC